THSSMFVLRIARLFASCTCVEAAPTILSRLFLPFIDTFVHLLRSHRRVLVSTPTENRELLQQKHARLVWNHEWFRSCFAGGLAASLLVTPPDDHAAVGLDQ